MLSGEEIQAIQGGWGILEKYTPLEGKGGKVRCRGEATRLQVKKGRNGEKMGGLQFDHPEQFLSLVTLVSGISHRKGKAAALPPPPNEHQAE